MKNVTILILLSLFISVYSNATQSFGEPKTMPLSKSDLKQLRIPYNGMFVDGVKWKDTQGNHVVFYAATGLYESREEEPGDGLSAEIFAYHYIYGDNPNHAKQVWDFQKAELNCPLAALLEFIDGSFHVTDINNDGIAEVWFAYRGGCSGDISPWGMSVVMYEGNKEYKMSGDVKIILGGGEQAGGKYEFDRNFRSAPDAIRKFADDLWKKHCFYFDYSKEK